MRIALNYLYNLHVALSQLANTVLGGDPDESLSGRIGKSIHSGGWASQLPWPDFASAHFLASIETDEGGNSAVRRTDRV